MPEPRPVTEFAPAKINLFLAVTGRRSDGFHDLVSLVAPLAWGDTLAARPLGSEKGQNALLCDSPSVPTDDGNLVHRAARAFAQATGWEGRVEFTLTKRIPVGAGLGGGSSDAAAALRILQQLSGGLVASARLSEIAASIGSDCPLFLKKGPVLMRGRGERVQEVPDSVRRRLSGLRVLLFKPAFAIATLWAYQHLASSGAGAYLPEREAEARLTAWTLDPTAPIERLLFNSFEAPVHAKFPALPLVSEVLRDRFGLRVLLSGSGSAGFAILPEGFDSGPVGAILRETLGVSCFVLESRFA